MDFNIQVRKKQLLNLEQYIFTSNDKIHSILNCLGWNINEVLKDDPAVTCPLDSCHMVSEKNIGDHTEKCYLKREGYDMDENFLSEPLHDPQSSIYIDNNEKVAIFSQAARKIPSFRKGWNATGHDPKTADRLISTFSSDERSALHNYVISHTKGPPQPPEYNILVADEGPENRPLTEEEIRIHERNAKRRRIKYKAVHTNKKTYKEVLRDVIESQMEAYKDWLQETTERKPKETTADEGSDGNSQEYSRASDRISFDYTRDNSITSRGSNYSGSSRSSRHHRKHSHECKRGNSKDYENRQTKYSSHNRYHKDKFRDKEVKRRHREENHYKEYNGRSTSYSTLSGDERSCSSYKSVELDVKIYSDRRNYRDQDSRGSSQEKRRYRHTEIEKDYKGHRHKGSYQYRDRSRSRSRNSSPQSRRYTHHSGSYKSRK